MIIAGFPKLFPLVSLTHGAPPRGYETAYRQQVQTDDQEKSSQKNQEKDKSSLIELPSFHRSEV